MDVNRMQKKEKLAEGGNPAKQADNYEGKKGGERKSNQGEEKFREIDVLNRGLEKAYSSLY